jgi:ribosome assembly protein YihI (activator of Der GTPase)
MNWNDLNNNFYNNHNFKPKSRKKKNKHIEEEIKEEHITKQINKKLDEIIKIRAEIKRMDNDISEDQVLNNVETGEKLNKEEAMKVVEDMIDGIKNDLNEITNNGKNIKNIFTNKFYVNDFMQDKEITKENNISS